MGYFYSWCLYFPLVGAIVVFVVVGIVGIDIGIELAAGVVAR